jgi:hypothetical protein
VSLTRCLPHFLTLADVCLKTNASPVCSKMIQNGLRLQKDLICRSHSWDGKELGLSYPLPQHVIRFTTFMVQVQQRYLWLRLCTTSSKGFSARKRALRCFEEDCAPVAKNDHASIEAETIRAARCVATAKEAMRCPGPRVEGVNTRFGLRMQRCLL